MPDQYDPKDFDLIADGERIEQVKSFDPPEESYDDREYTQTMGDDDNVLLQDLDPSLEGDLEISPTSGSIDHLDELLREGTQFAMTMRFPADDVRDDKTWIGAVLTDGNDDTFDGSETNRSYSFIADHIA